MPTPSPRGTPPPAGRPTTTSRLPSGPLLGWEEREKDGEERGNGARRVLPLNLAPHFTLHLSRSSSSLRNKELSSVELRALDFEEATPGTAGGGGERGKSKSATPGPAAPASTSSAAPPPPAVTTTATPTPSTSTAPPGTPGADAPAAALERAVEDAYVAAEASRLASQAGGSLLEELLDISPLLHDAAAAAVDDSFLRCFTSAPADPWNWNAYLFPLWAGGVVLRHAILFPLRLALLLGGFCIFAVSFFLITPLLTARNPTRAAAWQKALVRFMCQIFVASWTAVVRYHGPAPAPRPGHVWVANHTSMIDYMLLCAYTPFAAIMQLHPGWVGFLQTRALSCLGCLWFNRTEVRDRALVAQRMRDHVASADSSPLLIFPEGTCVNNRYCVMFKRGAFDLGARVCPIAIRYDPVFVDAFWNSKKQSFTAHLLALMTSWAVVCDVYFLEPQARGEGESAASFAERVQKMIAARAGLAVAPWDGYLKYYNLAAKHPDLVEKRRALFAGRLRAVMPGGVGKEGARSASQGVKGAGEKKAGGLDGLRGLLRSGSGVSKGGGE